MTALLLGIDVGGTFTDVVALDRATGRLFTAKVPSTPADPSRAFCHGAERALEAAGAGFSALSHVFHGSTVATNAVLEGKGVRTGLITTAGFRHALEIGRHDIPRTANLYAWIKPRRPVPPEMIFEVPERIGGRGEVLQSLDDAAAHQAAARLRAAGVEAVAVCLLHSYVNPRHERRVAAVLERELPGVPVSLSSEILPVFREYERSMVTVLNAYITPRVSRYVARLQEELARRDAHAGLLIMKSDGGVYGAADAVRRPAHMLYSGPAAGVVGAIFTGAGAGAGNLITFDMGGTSTDVALVKNGSIQLIHEGTVGGWPVHVPMVDLATIGAGGGSIAAVTALGSFAVGPASAGADPGPACYGRGGTHPTVTDANLVLGRIPPYLLGGEIPLDRGLAEEAIHGVAKLLALSVEEAALGIVRIVDNNMVGAMRVLSVERGHDPRQFDLVAFGGCGPVHAGRLMDLLGVRRVIVPRWPGLLCALGLLASDLKSEYARTCLQVPPRYDYKEIARTYAALAAEATRWLEEEGIPEDQRVLMYSGDLCYERQGFELEAECPAGLPPEETVAALIEGFHRRHHQLYRYSAPEVPVRIVNLRVRAIGRLGRLTLPPPPAGGSFPAAQIDERRVLFEDAGWVTTPVYDRWRLPLGEVCPGPAVIQQHDSTTVVHPRHRFRVDPAGNLVIDRG